MRPILFDKKATDFSTNGLGRVECTSCIVTEERNNIYELEVEVVIGADNVDKLEMDSILVVRPSVGASLQAFRIYNISKPINGHFTVLAQHISYQLSYIPSMPFSVTASTNACAQVLTALKSNATESCPFAFTTDVTTVSSYTQTIPASIRQRLGGVEGSVLDQFGGEYEWDNYTVKLHKNRGKTVATATLAYGKNITDLTQEEYISSTVTGVCPYWKSNDEDGKLVTLPEKVIESPYANAYAYRRTIPLDLSSDFENEPSIAQLRNAASVYVNTAGLGVPRVSIDVSFIDLAGTEEYKDVAPMEEVKLCDMVNVYFEKLGISTTAKVVKTVYNVLTERYDSVEIGSLRTDLASTIYGQDGAIEAAENRAIFAISKSNVEINDEIDDLRDQINNATNWLTSSGGYVIAVRNTDGSWKELLFMDTNNTSTAKNVLCINENGIGFSSRGINGPYTQAWTLDGKIVIGGTNVPSLTVYDSSGKVLFQINNQGMEWNATNSSMTKDGKLTTKGMTATEINATGTLTAKDANGNTIFQAAQDGMMWSSTNSSMTKDGTLNTKNMVATSANINGYFKATDQNGDYIDIANSQIYFRHNGGSVCGLVAPTNMYGYSNGIVIDSDSIALLGKTLYSSNMSGLGGYGYNGTVMEGVTGKTFAANLQINLASNPQTASWDNVTIGTRQVINGIVT